MNKSTVPILIAVGAGALVLASRKKKKRRRRKDVVEEVHVEESTVEGKPVEVELEDLDGSRDEDLVEGFEVDETEVDQPTTMLEVLESLEDAGGLARLGSLYQVKSGDTLLEIACEALFGTRDVLKDPAMHRAVVELAIRIDCSPWNQTVYGRAKDQLRKGHPAISEGVSVLGISFDPVYVDNRMRMADSNAPSAASGNHFAYPWIPQINVDLFDSEGVVSTRGMDWPDTVEARGHNKIEPPKEILDLRFDDVVHRHVGCHLPDGDFRRTLEAYG